MSANTTYKILVVEDNNTMREGIVRVMKKLGHKVVDARDGETAVQQCQNNRFALMISDYKLRVLPDWSCLKRYQKCHPPCRFP